MPGAAPTASPPVLTPGTAAAHLNFEVWEEGFDGATYQRMQSIPRFSTIKRPYSLGHIRNAARLGGNTLASTAVGTGLLYQNPVGAEVTVTPSENYVAIAFSFGEQARTDITIETEFASELEQALSEASEESAMANFATLTQFRGNDVYNIEAGGLRNATSLLGRNTNGVFAVGDSTIYGILDWSQHSHLMSIEEYTHADIRGDSENPNVKGMWSKGGGVMMMLSTVCTTDANGTHGCIWVPSAFAIGWNVRSRVYRQDEELQGRLIVANSFGSTVRHDLRAVGLRTDNTIAA
jgi:hypothetical protein